MPDTITVTLTRREFDTIKAALDWVHEDCYDDNRIQEELTAALTALNRAQVESKVLANT